MVKGVQFELAILGKNIALPYRNINKRLGNFTLYFKQRNKKSLFLFFAIILHIFQKKLPAHLLQAVFFHIYFLIYLTARSHTAKGIISNPAYGHTNDSLSKILPLCKNLTP